MILKFFKVLGIVIAIDLIFGLIFALARPNTIEAGGALGHLIFGLMMFCILWLCIE
jgi:hypothetical protein